MSPQFFYTTSCVRLNFAFTCVLSGCCFSSTAVPIWAMCWLVCMLWVQLQMTQRCSLAEFWYRRWWMQRWTVRSLKAMWLSPDPRKRLQGQALPITRHGRNCNGHPNTRASRSLCTQEHKTHTRAFTCDLVSSHPKQRIAAFWRNLSLHALHCVGLRQNIWQSRCRRRRFWVCHPRHAKKSWGTVLAN